MIEDRFALLRLLGVFTIETKPRCNRCWCWSGPGDAGLRASKERDWGISVRKEKLPRYKCCARGVASKAGKLLDFDIYDVMGDVIYELSFTFDLASPYPGQHSQSLIYAVMRDVVDYSW